MQWKNYSLKTSRIQTVCWFTTKIFLTPKQTFPENFINIRLLLFAICCSQTNKQKLPVKTKPVEAKKSFYSFLLNGWNVKQQDFNILEIHHRTISMAALMLSIKQADITFTSLSFLHYFMEIRANAIQNHIV